MAADGARSPGTWRCSIRATRSRISSESPGSSTAQRARGRQEAPRGVVLRKETLLQPPVSRSVRSDAGSTTFGEATIGLPRRLLGNAMRWLLTVEREDRNDHGA